MGLFSSLKNVFKPGGEYYKSFVQQRNKYVESQIGPDPLNQLTMYRAGDDPGIQWTPEFTQQYNNYMQQAEQLKAQWLDTLDPATKQMAIESFAEHSADMQNIQTYGSMATKAMLAAIAGGAASAAFAGAGSTALSGADAAMADLANAGGLTAESMASSASGLSASTPEVAELMQMGYTEAQAIESVAQSMAEGGQVVNVTGQALPGFPEPTFSVDPGLLGPAAGSAINAAIPEIGAQEPVSNMEQPVDEPTNATPAENQQMQDLFKKEPWSFDRMIDFAKGMSLDQWVKAGLGTAAMYNMAKGMTASNPAVPDFKGLAEQDAAAKAKAQEDALRAGRPNQTNAYGDTRAWTQDANGNWVQKDTFGTTNQGLYDTAASLRGGLMERAKNTAPLTKEGLPDLGGIVMDPQGSNDAITQAWLARMRPELDRGREAEMQRLANMGVTENRMGGENQAFGNAMDVLNRKDVDATNQALIYGTDAYNKTFANSVQADQANRQNYQTEFNTNETVANNPYYQLNQSANAIPGSPTFAPTGNVSPNATPDLSGAAGLDYAAQLKEMQGKLAQYEQNAKGLWDMYKTIGG